MEIKRTAATEDSNSIPPREVLPESRPFQIKRRLRNSLVGIGFAAVVALGFPLSTSAQESETQRAAEIPRLGQRTVEAPNTTLEQNVGTETLVIDKKSGVTVIIDAEGIPLRYVLPNGEVKVFNPEQRKQMSIDRQKAINMKMYVPSQVLYSMETNQAATERDFTPVVPEDAMSREELLAVGIEVIQPNRAGSTKLLLSKTSPLVQAHRELSELQTEEARQNATRKLTIIVVDGPTLAPEHFDTQLGSISAQDRETIRSILSGDKLLTKDEALAWIDADTTATTSEVEELEKNFNKNTPSEKEANLYYYKRGILLLRQVVMAKQPGLLLEPLMFKTCGKFLLHGPELSSDFILLAAGSTTKIARLKPVEILDFAADGSVGFSGSIKTWWKYFDFSDRAPDFDDERLISDDLTYNDELVQGFADQYSVIQVENPSFLLLHEYVHHLPHLLLDYWKNGGDVRNLTISKIFNSLNSRRPDLPISIFYSFLLHNRPNNETNIVVPAVNEWITDALALYLLESADYEKKPFSYWLQTEGPKQNRSPWIID